VTDSKIEELSLTRPQLGEIADALAARIRRGLAASGEELAMLPTYLPEPDREVAGEALVVDVGGTNVRAARLALDASGRAAIPAGDRSAALKNSWNSPAEFFSFQASLVPHMRGAQVLPLGYCFSYPSRSLPDRDAVLLGWTKELRVPGAVGEKVGAALKEALRKEGVETGKVTVCNDTVAALVGGSWKHEGGSGFSDFVGLIVGTGNNMAAFFPTRLITSGPIDHSYRRERMAVNLESGNFHPPHLSRFDDELDETRPDAGAQRLEKAVSGKFLPPLYGYLLTGRVGTVRPSAEELFRLAYEEGSSPEGKLAAAVVNRSADLVAATLAGLLEVLEPEGKVGILAEGSVIEKNPLYRKRVENKLELLLGKGEKGEGRFELLQLDNVNLIGAAVAALIGNGKIITNNQDTIIK